MNTIPYELADARENVENAWNEYNLMLDREHTTEEFTDALAKATQAEYISAEWYRRWEAVGGTSDITSIVDAEMKSCYSLNTTRVFSGQDSQYEKPSLPPIVSWNEAMQKREQDFNRRYYGNAEGKPEWDYPR